MFWAEGAAGAKAQSTVCMVIPEIIMRKPRVGGEKGRFALDVDARVGNMVKAPGEDGHWELP